MVPTPLRSNLKTAKKPSRTAMPKLPTARSADGDTIDVKPYPPTSPKKSGAKQTKKQASPSDDTLNDLKSSGSASPKKATGKQAAKKWSKQDKIDILLKVVQTASPDWQVSLQPRLISVLSLTKNTRMRYRLWLRNSARVGPRARCMINGGKPDSGSFPPLFLCSCRSFGFKRQHILPSLKSDGRVMKSE